MSLRSMKIVAWGATHSAHDEMDVECFHCHALKALEGIMALEKAAKVLNRAIIQACNPVTREQVNEAHELMATIAKEAE